MITPSGNSAALEGPLGGRKPTARWRIHRRFPHGAAFSFFFSPVPLQGRLYACSYRNHAPCVPHADPTDTLSRPRRPPSISTKSTPIDPRAKTNSARVRRPWTGSQLSPAPCPSLEHSSPPQTSSSCTCTPPRPNCTSSSPAELADPASKYCSVPDLLHACPEPPRFELVGASATRLGVCSDRLPLLRRGVGQAE